MIGALILALLPRSEAGWVLAMDREFLGEKWLMWLKFLEIRYVVRVKRNARIGGNSAALLSERNRWKTWAGQPHLVFGQQVHFAAKRIHKGRDSHVAVISYGFSGEEALALCYRWGQNREQPEPKKKLKNHGYRAKSIFRLGFEKLHCSLLTPIKFAEELARFFDLLIRLPLAENNFV